MSSPQVTPFAPIRFLAVMAAGGFASAPFLWETATAGLSTPLAVAALMFSAFFVFVHLALSGVFTVQAVAWLSKRGARTFMTDLTKAPQIVMPLASLAMTVNVFMGPVRNLVPALDRFAFVWQPVVAIIWAIDAIAIVALTAVLVARLLKNVPTTKPLGFVWLFPVLALGLSAAAGAFVASEATIPLVAHVTGIGVVLVTLAGLALIALLGPRVVGTLAKGPSGVPRGTYYSFFNLVPTAALFAIAFAHWAGYANNWLGVDLSVAAGVTVAVAWSFGLIYTLFTAKALFTYLRTDLSERQYFGNQWALTCVPIAWSVLTVLLYATVGSNPVWAVLSGLVFVGTLPMAFLLGARLLTCTGLIRTGASEVVCG